MAHFEHRSGSDTYVQLRASQGEVLPVEMVQAWALLRIALELENIREEIAEFRSAEQ